MKILNKYTYLFLGIVLLGVVILFTIIPNFETQEFNPDKVQNISENLSTNTTINSNNQNKLEGNLNSPNPIITGAEKSEIEKLLINNEFDFILFNNSLSIRFLFFVVTAAKT